MFITHGVVHYCVPNMTANIARTASRALSDAVLQPMTTMAMLGVDRALRQDPGLAAGVSVYRGEVVNAQLGRVMGAPVRELRLLLPNTGDRP